jgi:hypothetical protein
MSDEPIQLTPGPPVGSFIKVCRLGECLWLKVKQVRARKKIVAVVDNTPVIWSESRGDAVTVRYDEVIDWKPAQPGEK